jgi:hypothetical protein
VTNEHARVVQRVQRPSEWFVLSLLAHLFAFVLNTAQLTVRNLPAAHLALEGKVDSARKDDSG